MRLSKDERDLIISALCDRHNKLGGQHTKLLNWAGPFHPVIEKVVVAKQKVNALLLRLEREDEEV